MGGRGPVIVGLSGGVDSSVAALILVRQGYPVEGLFMKNWEEDDSPHYCAAAADLADAQAVAEILGIRLHRVNFATEYWDRVFDHFLDEYRAGRTPNPDVLCNSEIKFRAFLDHALGLGAERIATGHYARLGHGAQRWHLLQSADHDKDQTYFLHRLDQYQLARSRFPLGDLNKAQVRSLAREAGLLTAGKKDSTGICFIGERRFRDFLSRYLPHQPGDIETAEGQRIGAHLGLMYYTIGQRQGLGIGGVASTAEAPWFVARKDFDHNRLIVVQGHDHPLLYHQSLDAGPIHWIGSPPEPTQTLCCQARIRHRQPLEPCRVTLTEGASCRVTFDRPQWAIAPGQSVVFYQDQECLGGGIIHQAIDDQGNPSSRAIHRA